MTAAASLKSTIEERFVQKLAGITLSVPFIWMCLQSLANADEKINPKRLYHFTFVRCIINAFYRHKWFQGIWWIQKYIIYTLYMVTLCHFCSQLLHNAKNWFFSFAFPTKWLVVASNLRVSHSLKSHFSLLGSYFCFLFSCCCFLLFLFSKSWNCLFHHLHCEKKKYQKRNRFMVVLCHFVEFFNKKRKRKMEIDLYLYDSTKRFVQTKSMKLKRKIWYFIHWKNSRSLFLVSTLPLIMQKASSSLTIGFCREYIWINYFYYRSEPHTHSYMYKYSDIYIYI